MIKNKQKKQGISVVLNTFNEEKNVERCLSSVMWADEIIVVDMHSVDKTAELAKEFTKKLYQFKNVGYVEPARNFAISKANHEWVLVIDADEVIPLQLAQLLRSISNKDPDGVSAYYIAEKNIFFGQWINHSGWWPDPHIRFFRNGSIVWSDVIHSKPEVLHGGIKSLPSDPELAIEHYPYARHADFLKKMNGYTDKEAESLHDKGVKFSLRSAILRSINEFYFRYWRARGIKGGRTGFILSTYMAFYYFISYTKLLDLEKPNV